jgi:UDP-N-acetylmuramoylalanine--D-glutamate ligase
MKVRKTLIELGDMEIISTDSLESAVNKSFEIAKKGDTVLFSPGFGAGGLYDSRKSRGEAFVKLVKGLKTVK